MSKGKPLFFDMGQKSKDVLEAEDFWDILFHARAKKREAGGYYTTCPASLQPPPPPVLHLHTDGPVGTDQWILWVV